MAVHPSRNYKKYIPEIAHCHGCNAQQKLNSTNTALALRYLGERLASHAQYYPMPIYSESARSLETKVGNKNDLVQVYDVRTSAVCSKKRFSYEVGFKHTVNMLKALYLLMLLLTLVF